MAGTPTNDKHGEGDTPWLKNVSTLVSGFYVLQALDILFVEEALHLLPGEFLPQSRAT